MLVLLVLFLSPSMGLPGLGVVMAPVYRLIGVWLNLIGMGVGMSADGGNTAYRVTLPEFEGPLDLLLHLCKTHEIDIVNIPIAFITRKYLEYLEVMQSMSVDVAADYLVMAATLAYLKSRELVPTPEPLDTTGEEGGERAGSARGADPAAARIPEVQERRRAAGRAPDRRPHGVPARRADRQGRSVGAAVRRPLGLEADRGVREDSGEGGKGAVDPRRRRRSRLDRRRGSASCTNACARAAARSGSTPVST